MLHQSDGNNMSHSFVAVQNYRSLPFKRGISRHTTLCNSQVKLIWVDESSSLWCCKSGRRGCTLSSLKSFLRIIIIVYFQPSLVITEEEVGSQHSLVPSPNNALDQEGESDI